MSEQSATQEGKGRGNIGWVMVAVTLLLVNYVIGFALEGAKSSASPVIGAFYYGVFAPMLLSLLYVIPKANRSIKHDLKAVSVLTASVIFVGFSDLQKAHGPEKVGASAPSILLATR